MAETNLTPQQPDETRGPKEVLYDERIFPHMRAVIEICKAAGIGCLCSFALDRDEEDEWQLCTTALDDGSNCPDAMKAATKLILSGRSNTPMVLTTKDKDGNIVAQEVIM